MITSDYELKQYLQRIKDNQAKITTQRIEILKVLIDHKHEHLTAEDIVKQLNDSKIGQATVYRTLELFCSCGILNKVNFKKEEMTRYDLIDLNKKHFHHHLICNQCGKVIEINDDLEKLEKTIQENYGFKIINHELTISGICKECQNGDRDEN